MPRQRHTTLKVVVTGPFNAGKTTLISTISEIPVLTTETSVSDAARERKKRTTVSMDFGRITVPGDPVIELAMFGTPGQARFDFMWNVLSKGMLGYVLMVDVADPSTWEEAAAIRDHFRVLGRVPYVVAANRSDGDDTAPLALRRFLALPEDVRVVPCNVVEIGSAKDVMLALLVDVLTAITTRPGPVSPRPAPAPAPVNTSVG